MCANYLLDSGITESDKLAIEGGSAGCLVVGNYLNTNPGRCRVAVAHVPFVDILTTILDDSLPLSITERDEWGDPNEKESYDYIKSYSPYDNVSAGRIPCTIHFGWTERSSCRLLGTSEVGGKNSGVQDR